MKKLTYIILLLALAACGDNGFNQEPWLFDLRVSPEVARVGELVSVQIEFEPALTPDSDNELMADSTHVTITLPRGIDFVFSHRLYHDGHSYIRCITSTG